MTKISSRKQTIKDHKTISLAVSGWLLDGGRYKYTISDTDIVDGCLVVHSYDNANYEAVKAAEFLQSTSSVGSLVLWAVGRPIEDITIKYTII